MNSVKSTSFPLWRPVVVKMNEKELGYRNWEFYSKVRSLLNEILLPIDVGEVQEQKEEISVERVDLPEMGILTFYKGYEYPYSGFAIDEIVERVDEAKKSGMALFKGIRKILQSRVMGLIFLVVFYRQAQEIGTAFIGASFANIRNKRLKDERYCRPVREVRKVMQQIGVWYKVADIISMLLEFDNAYRARFQWILERFNRESFKRNSVKELQRLLGILEEAEEQDYLKGKWRTISKFLWFLYFKRNLRKKVEYFFNNLKIEEVVMTVEDVYHASKLNWFKIIWQ